MLVKVLRHASFDVRKAVDGCEAQHRLIQSLPDVLLLDVNMPGPPGLAVIQYVYQAQRNSYVKIIVVTGDYLAQQTEAAEQADLFLLKPVNPGDLVAVSNRLMQSGDTSSQRVRE